MVHAPSGPPVPPLPRDPAKIVPFPTPSDLPAAPRLDLPRTPEHALGQVPGISIGQRGKAPNLPHFARRRHPPRPFPSGQHATRPPAMAPPSKTVVNVSPPAPQAPTKPGTEIPHALADQAPKEASAADRFRGLLGRLNRSQREKVRDMARRNRAEQEARAKRAGQYKAVDATMDALRQPPASSPPATTPPGGQP